MQTMIAGVAMNTIAANSHIVAPPAADAVMQLIAIIGDPARASAALADLTRVRDEALAAQRDLGDLKAKAATLAKERSAFDGWCAAERGKIEQALADIEADRQRLQSDRDAHLREVAAHGEATQAFEAAQARHAEALAELARFRRAIAA
jgi:hypothetical protein